MIFNSFSFSLMHFLYQWIAKGDILKNAKTALFKTMKVNRDWCCLASKIPKSHHKSSPHNLCARFQVF